MTLRRMAAAMAAALLTVFSAGVSPAMGSVGSADVQFHWAGYKGPVKVGDDMNASLDVGNDGPDKAIAVRIRFHFPANFSYVSGDPECTGWTNSVVCRVRHLRPGHERIVNFVLHAVSAGTANMKGTVTSGTPDPNPANNTIKFPIPIS